MSEYYDIKKLYVLSRLELDDSEFQQTDNKIKEIIDFFKKLDEFETDDNIEGNEKEDDIAPDNNLKLEKKIDDLRDDIPNSKLDFQKIDANIVIKEEGTAFNFKFHNKKNGYVIGPRI